MKYPKAPVILYFIAGVRPTKEDILKSTKLRGKVSYRNASAVGSEEACEPCDGVSGAVPDTYKKHPSAEQAIATYDADFEAASKLIEDSPAPVVPSAKSDAKDQDGKPTNLPGGDGKLPAWGSKVPDTK